MSLILPGPMHLAFTKIRTSPTDSFRSYLTYYDYRNPNANAMFVFFWAAQGIRRLSKSQNYRKPRAERAVLLLQMLPNGIQATRLHSSASAFQPFLRRLHSCHCHPRPCPARVDLVVTRDGVSELFQLSFLGRRRPGCRSTPRR